MKALASVQEFDSLKDAPKVLVDFWAPWCGPCKALIPVLESIEAQYPDITFVKINTDEDWASELVQSYAIASLPTLILFKNGKVEGRCVGATSRSKLSEFLNE